MVEYISFGYDGEIKQVDIDLNDPRVGAHLKALIRGFGSTTESILIDFVKEEWRSIRIYNSVHEAWAQLDTEQKNMVAGFRSFIGKSFLCDCQSAYFPTIWFRRIVANEYSEALDQLPNRDQLTIKEKAVEAGRAEVRIRALLNSDDPSQAWMIERGE